MPIVLVLLYCWLNQMAYKFIPTRYVDNNSKLLARILLKIDKILAEWYYEDTMILIKRSFTFHLYQRRLIQGL